MTAQILSSDLTTIIQETKRKSPDIRSAAEQSLQDLKSLPSTSEAQLAADLRRRPYFINPFLAACKGRHAKATVPAVSCLQRLIVSAGLPKERLKEVLEAFQECVSNGLDVQLKILQSLPSLLQTYGGVLEGELQAMVLQLCTALQQVKNSAVSSTASATLQQTVSTLYEKVEAEDENSEEIAPIEGVLVGGESVPVRSAAFDAYRAIKDICLIIEGQAPSFLIKATISSTFGLELIESLLLNHAEVFETHAEQADLLLQYVMPLVNWCLSERHSFSVTVRAIRVFCILMREHLQTVHTECEIAFGLLNHAIETESQQPWRRALCMETFRLLYSNPELFVEVYSTFDMEENRRNVIQDNLALFVRLASEKPALIGLGQQSTIPTTQSSASASQDQAVLEAENAAGMIGSDFGVSEKNVPGISAEWSSMKVPCLDQLDKADGPTVPETYIYSLVLTCVNHLSEILAKIVLPIAMHQNKPRKVKSPPPKAESGSPQQKEQPSSPSSKPQARQSSLRSHGARSIPTNPLELTDNPAHASVQVVASLISSCWPAVLATCSTFFNAALDADFYRSLVRSFQKFTQVAGILRLATPRDALLTALAKVAVPPNVFSSDSIMSPTSGVSSPGASIRIRGFTTPTSESISSSTGQDTPPKRRSSLDMPKPALTQRNLMCLRALVHLAIALGPILDSAWSIVLDTTQKAHVLLKASRTAATAHDYKASQTSAEPAGGQPTLGSEIAAVESAISRLFSSSSDYPEESFKTLLVALCSLLHNERDAHPIKTPALPQSTPTSTLAAPSKPQRRVPSVSGLVTNADIRPEYLHFSISSLGETAKANLLRLTQSPEEGWHSLLETLIKVTTDHETDEVARKMAADIIARLAAEACISTTTLDEEIRMSVQERCFLALKTEVDGLPQYKSGSPNSTDLDIHLSALESLRSVLEHCGDSVITGWDAIFTIADSIFPHRSSKDGSTEESRDLSRPLSARLARSSFASLQLICSDFLESLPSQNFSLLVRILAKFGSQTLDINISLTVVTLFWNVSDYLQKQIDQFDVESGTALSTGEPSVERQTRSNTVSSIWMNLQQQLAEMIHDQRADVRNGSIHIIYRTLDSCGDQLSDSALNIFFRTVLFRALEIDSNRQQEVGSEETSQDIIKGFNNSSKIIIEGCARSVATYLTRILQLSTFPQLWHSLLEKLVVYLEAGSYIINGIVFSALAQILKAVPESQQFPREAVNEIASLWARRIPKPRDASEEDANTQEKAYVDYVTCIQQIYRLISDVHVKQSSIVLERLQQCVSTSVAPPYTNDIDKPTQLQVEVMECCSVIQQGSNETVPLILKQLADFIQLPYAHRTESARSRGLSFVALAKSAMDSAREFITQYGSDEKLDESDAFIEIFDALTRSVREQYTQKIQGKDPALWRKATSLALEVLQVVLPHLAKYSLNSKHRTTLWSGIVSFADAVQHAEVASDVSDDDLVSDEAFELDAIVSFRKLVTRNLDRSIGLDDVRTRYIDSLFNASILHESTFDNIDQPPSAFTEQYLNSLLNVRLGRTCEPPFNPRIRMCYSCFDELFNLATAKEIATDFENGEGKANRKSRSLAEISLSAIIGRCAIPLRRYIADQPLRGRMPTPMSQRLELLHILRKIQMLYTPLPELGDNAEAFHDPYRILKYLAPLVSRAREITGTDRELANAMSKVVAIALPR